MFHPFNGILCPCVDLPPTFCPLYYYLFATLLFAGGYQEKYSLVWSNRKGNPFKLPTLGHRMTVISSAAPHEAVTIWCATGSLSFLISSNLQQQPYKNYLLWIRNSLFTSPHLVQHLYTLGRIHMLKTQSNSTSIKFHLREAPHFH